MRPLLSKSHQSTEHVEGFLMATHHGQGLGLGSDELEHRFSASEVAGLGHTPQDGFWRLLPVQAMTGLLRANQQPQRQVS
ncbi:unnamed protein product [[Actinomadura] parvosata subsp. kistnae]|uniref:Uncharacterized protein n=1 Tax=[Actinomadura] parvosata subsp. kistnae TaxID=1909395 RepID=A0A1U9ZXT9_9ACTN|nr:hypothetical protein [Nonomuraea sp. ATCC 55076]AQZ62750.1 hypothetical protein BKM31_15940 [Nonomuraea sp. ATCC 55076]SPL89467.1 unnamed protein product [Actinomadura parvosata subsp. kistnae]